MFDQNEYLRRICVEPPARLNAQVLAELTSAHMEAVPFENLEITDARRSPSLEIGDLYHKVVVSRRGGYCFELNKLYYQLLQTLGFSCYPVGARVILDRPLPRPVSHRATVVHIEGEPWFVDVGFGGPGPRGILSMTRRDPQHVGGAVYRVEEADGVYSVCRQADEGPQLLMMFKDEPFEDVDFDVLHGYASVHPKSVFSYLRVLSRRLPDGVMTLTGSEFKVVRGDRTESRILESEDEIRRVIAEEFFITVPEWGEAQGA